MISKDEVRHIAQLARLGITKEEEEKFSHDLSSILDYMRKLQEVDLKNIRPTSHSLTLENNFREDEIKTEDRETVKKLINLAPGKDGNYIKVKSILKDKKS